MDELFDKLVNMFRRYYDVDTQTPCSPFAASAEFHSHTEQYVFVKAAHISDIDSNEYVYFAKEDELTLEKLDELVNSAWNDGLSKVKPVSGHRNSDVSLFIIAQKINDDIKKKIKKIRLYKSYAFGFRGWSAFKLVAMENDSKTLSSNRLGRDLKKIFMKII